MAALRAANTGRRRRALRWLALGYLVLLALSSLWRFFAGDEDPPLGPEVSAVEVAVQDSAGARPESEQSPGVRLAFREWGGAAGRLTDGAEQPALPLLMLHGSPGSHRDFSTLAPALANHGIRSIAPDLPGFGASSRQVPDYSILAHARYSLALMDQLGIERAHLLGFSMGGGVALEIYRLAPSRVASMTLLSSIGVQEMELLGSYPMNHLLHALQLSAVQTALWALPHFGRLDRSMLGKPYARNFFDTDQRPLRSVLAAFEPPMLIIHGAEDPLVPPAAAREHHRLVPQSRLLMLDSSHFYIFAGGERIAPDIAEFIAAVEQGSAPRRADATPQQLTEAAAPFDSRSLPPLAGLSLIVIMVLLALATLVSEDLTCVGAGLLVAQGRIDFLPAAFACFAGIYVGDMMLFWAGRWLGRPALRLPPFKWWVTEAAVQRSSAWFQRRGAAVIFLSRFLPGARLPTYFAAGLLRTRFLFFAGFFFLAAAVWTPMLVALSRWFGAEVIDRFEELQRHGWLLLLLAVAFLLVLRKLVLPLFTWRGRRRLVGSWRRWSRWEFWPPWLFYPPVVLHVLWLGVRHRCPTLFTAANPGIPTGGFIGESKSQILSLHREESRHLPHWALIPPSDEEAQAARRLALVEQFRSANGLDFPIVLKPDVGQRGSGVVIARDPHQVARYLDRNRGPVLAQEYLSGPEFGVFYFRKPGASEGCIFSITEKILPRLTGDGESTIERLVAADRRAVILADLYLDRLSDPDRVPAAGEEVALAELGTHCRGAIFLDGAHHRTPRLEAAIERLSRGFAGFSFGRYDLRAASAEAFRRGEFKLIELNGVTSEATHIYDPRHSLAYAWSTLRQQWRLAFEIGAQHRAAGVEPTSIGQLFRALRGYRRQAGDHPEEGSLSG